MKYNYLIYFLSLFTSFVIYMMFGMMMTVAAGFSNIPLISFLAAIIHFGISSWIIFVNTKYGRIIGIVTIALMLIWPMLGIIEFEGFLFPILLCGGLLYLYLKKLNKTVINIPKPLLILTIAIPFLTMLYYILNYLIPFFIK